MASCDEQKANTVPQPTVTISANSTTPMPPSTPKPQGPEWWKERKAEAVQEQMEIIEDQAQKIQSLQKQIADNRDYREHNDELVAANVEIYEALKHWGLEQSEPCSLVSNVKHVIQLCAERGKAHFEQKDKIERLNDQIDAQSKVIAELTNQRDQWEKLAAKRSGEMNRRSDMIDYMEKQCDRKDKDLKYLKDVVDSQAGKIASLRESVDNRTNKIEELNKQLSVAGKKRLAIVEVGNHISALLGTLADQSTLASHRILAKQYIGLWKDNTTP
jgi:DNA repair exonuclease SbcCD ATPase subunit